MNSMLEPNAKQGLVDPITLEVIRHGIVSITDQIDANIARTAFSPYVYEYKDFALVGPHQSPIRFKALKAVLYGR